MRVSQKQYNGTKIELYFEIPWDELQGFLNKGAAELGKDLILEGFRPGKIPRSIVEKKLGKERVLARGAEIAVRERYIQYVREKEIDVISPPQVEVLKLAWGNPFEFKIKVEILPEISLPDYKTIASEIPREKIEVEEKEVDQTLEWLQKSRAKFFELKRPAEKGDFVEIEYSSPQLENGKKFQDQFFLGKGQFVDGFEKHLEGMEKGEKKSFSILFPKDYQRKELAAKTVQFEVEMKKIQKVEIPELNDEFAKKLGRFENLHQLRESIKEGIWKEKEIKAKEKRREKILQAISQKTEFPLPETLVEREKKRLLENLKQHIKKTFNLSFQDYLKNIKKEEKDIENSLEKEAKERIKKFLILREIGKRENIQLREDEIEEAINEVLKTYPNIEKAKKEIDLPSLKEYYKSVIFNEKVFQILENF